MHLPLLITCLFAFLALTASADDAKKRKDYVTRVESCEAILREFQANPKTAIPAEVLQKAQAIVIVNQFQAGVILGGKGGNGVVLVRQPNKGGWSVPGFLDAGEASLGLQLGAKAVYTVYVIVDEVGARLPEGRRPRPRSAYRCGGRGVCRERRTARAGGSSR